MLKTTYPYIDCLPKEFETDKFTSCDIQ